MQPYPYTPHHSPLKPPIAVLELTQEHMHKNNSIPITPNMFVLAPKWGISWVPRLPTNGSLSLHKCGYYLHQKTGHRGNQTSSGSIENTQTVLIWKWG